jgi:hypothetical protein
MLGESLKFLHRIQGNYRHTNDFMRNQRLFSSQHFSDFLGPLTRDVLFSTLRAIIERYTLKNNHPSIFPGHFDRPYNGGQSSSAFKAPHDTALLVFGSIQSISSGSYTVITHNVSSVMPQTA